MRIRNQKEKKRMYFVGLVVLLDSWFGVLVLLPFPFLDISVLKKLMQKLMPVKVEWRGIAL